MASILYLIVVVICVLMFFVDINKKYMLLLVNYICFSFVTLPSVPFGNSMFLIPICFFFSELKNIKSDYNYLTSYVKRILLIMIFATIILLINSPHYNDSVYNMIRLVISELITKYFIIAYAFLSIKKLNDFYKSVNYVYYAIIILTFFGLLNFMTGNAILFNSIGGESVISDRFRVKAMFANSFDYGFICILLLFFVSFLYKKKLINLKKYYISLACCIFGVLVCGSRSILLTALTSYIFYVLISKSLRKKIHILFTAFMLSILCYHFIPSINEKIDQTLTVFTDVSGNEVSGSNIEMRKGQYLTTFIYIKDNPLFGRGKDFFNIDLGWKDIKENRDLVITDLAGLEGVGMSILLERGFVGLLFYLIFYISLFVKFTKYRKNDRETSSIGLSILSAYMLFANSNGELNSVGPTLLVCGALLHILETQKRDYLQKRN